MQNMENPGVLLRRNKAFTLAEVLITLAIIGIVATLTIPGLIAKHQKKEMQARLKKGYSMIQQALLKHQAETGEIIIAKDSNQFLIKPILTKYMKVVKDCGNGVEAEACHFNGNPIYLTYSKKREAYPIYFDDGQFITTDGMLILIENSQIDNFGNLFISLDLNGLDKGPNHWGMDLFTFQVMLNGKLLPMGAEGTVYTDMEVYCSKTSTERFNGIACTNSALYDENYWK